eukprot:GHVR01014670.1.p1 GENE.GHVR01014670.1~~GHVR01014670.1.p1  ORF type:complete len:192 (-),score=50.08 GHVR01014670.1:285-860(-)
MLDNNDICLKILVLGEPGVGKTSFLRSFCSSNDSNDSNSPYQSDPLSSRTELTRPWTTGCNIFVKIFTLNTCREGISNRVTVEFWDIGGCRAYSPIRSLFYYDFNGVMLVYDIGNIKSHSLLCPWLVELCTRDVYPSAAFWTDCKDVCVYESSECPSSSEVLLSGRIPIIIIANKIDIITHTHTHTHITTQ